MHVTCTTFQAGNVFTKKTSSQAANILQWCTQITCTVHTSWRTAYKHIFQYIGSMLWWGMICQEALLFVENLE